MKVLDLFSGIGGFSLGLERAGMETVAFCEIDPYCRKVLKKHWPDVPIHEDIKELDGEQYRGTVDVVCGGFPCQPFSTAGERGGKNDDRDLWPQMFRVIREVQPAWIIGENVAGFINMELDRTLSDLEGAGYACQTFDIPACGVGAPHIRHRVWIVANSESKRKRSGDEGRQNERRGEQLEGTGARCDPDYGGESKLVASPSSERLERRDRPETVRKAFAISSRASSRNESWAEWPVEPSVGRVATRIPNRVDRIKGLGNAVVPQIPEIIGRAILKEVSDD